MVIRSLSEYQNKILDTLSVFDKICRDNGLRYSIAYGSMIGAVRHKAMIPWDDDVDVLMPRADFIKFAKVMENYGDSNYYLEKPRNKEFFFDFVYHFINKSEKVISREDGEIHMSKELNMYFDIFILDETVKGIKNRIQVLELEILYSLARSYREVDFPVTYKGMLRPLVNLAVRGSNFVGRRIPLVKITDKYDRVSTKYNGVGNSYFVSNSTINDIKSVFDNDWFDELIEMEMANHMVLISAHYDELLKKSYGNYMELPPESERKPSHYYFDE